MYTRLVQHGVLDWLSDQLWVAILLRYFLYMHFTCYIFSFHGWFTEGGKQSVHTWIQTHLGIVKYVISPRKTIPNNVSNSCPSIIFWSPMESLLFSKNISLSYIIKVNGFYDMFTCMFCFESWINLIATFFSVVHVYCACQLRLVQYHEWNIIREFLVPQCMYQRS